MPRKFKLDAKVGKIGKWKPTEQHHGDKEVVAVDIPIRAVLINRTELNALLFPHAANLLFNERTGGRATDPVFAEFIHSPFKLVKEFEGTLSIDFGPNVKAIEFEEVTFRRMTIEPLPGGQTCFECIAQVNEDATAHMTKLGGYLNSEVTFTIAFGDEVKAADENQQPLGIDGEEDGKGAKKERGLTIDDVFPATH